MISSSDSCDEDIGDSFFHRSDDSTWFEYGGYPTRTISGGTDTDIADSLDGIVQPKNESEYQKKNSYDFAYFFLWVD